MKKLYLLFLLILLSSCIDTIPHNVHHKIDYSKPIIVSIDPDFSSSQIHIIELIFLEINSRTQNQISFKETNFELENEEVLKIMKVQSWYPWVVTINKQVEEEDSSDMLLGLYKYPNKIWIVDDKIPTNTLFRGVISHEIGHFFDMVHSKNPNSLMSPTLNYNNQYCIDKSFLMQLDIDQSRVLPCD